MKPFLFLPALLLACGLRADIITVDNNPNGVGQFSNIGSAIQAANNFDTLYISGSASSYGNANVTKPLIIFGSGYNPDNQFEAGVTIASMNINSNADGSRVSGINVRGLQLSGGVLADVIISECQIANFVVQASVNTLIQNCIIYSSTSNPAINVNSISKDVVFQNCIIYNLASNTINLIAVSSDCIQTEFRNCLFINGSDGSATVNISRTSTGVYNTTFLNNIYYFVDFGDEDNQLVFDGTFKNNLAFGGSETDFRYGTNSSENDIFNQDPLFVLEEDNQFDLSDDYQLQGGSPAINAGLDGTDMGLFGGPSPFPSATLQAGTLLPRILELNLLNLPVEENGTLQIKLQAESKGN